LRKTTKKLQGPARHVMCNCLPTKTMHFPSVRASIVLLGAAAGLVGLALIAPEPPANDLPGLAACQLLHPDRYCRLTYAPSTIAP